MISWYRYIAYDRLLLAICDGWTPVADLGPAPRRIRRALQMVWSK